ncbi:hypothetical protein Gpo141_00013737 [Globisporangium polare]
MATHLAHNLPWASIGDVYRQRFPRASRANRDLPRLKYKKVVEHFARCFTDALKEFAASDTATDDEREQYDPKTWPGVFPEGRGGWMGYHQSLLLGYFELNMILSDPQVFMPVVLNGGQRRTWCMDVLCDDCDGGHPQWLADHMKQVFDDQRHFKPLTAEVMQTIRDHAALLFQCMYRVGGDNKDNRFMDPEYVAQELLYFVC